MAISMKDVDSAFQGAGQKDGMEIWRIENFLPVPVPTSSYGKFFTGDSYVILKTIALRHDIHFWLGKDTSQDEAGTAAIKTVELDAALGGCAVQYREIQGHETEKFLSYFKPCLIPQKGGVASGFKHTEMNEHEHETRLYVCHGKHVVHVKEVSFARSSLNHDDIFILDTKSKIFQFNGTNSSIQERAKALEVVQYVKDTYHDGKCEVAVVEDGKLMADAEAGEFWGLFGGFAPLPRKSSSEMDKKTVAFPVKLLCFDKGQQTPVLSDSLTRDLLNTNNCYLLDCGVEVFVWMGRNTSLENRKSTCVAAEELVRCADRPHAHVVRVIEGFETVIFRSKFATWTQITDVAVSEDGRGKVAALLKRQGLNVKGLTKASTKEPPHPYIDCTGNLQVWRVNGNEKSLLPSSHHSKFYSGDCYIFQYSYPGEDKEDFLVGTWFGKKSVQEERSIAISLASKMVESLKSQAVQVRLYEGKEPTQLFSIFQSFIVYKGGVSSGYKNFVAESTAEDETYSEDGVALFRVQGSGPENMQAIQVETATSSLNSAYCYILHNGNTVFTWSGNLTSSEDQELVERQLDVIKPNTQSKPQKEGTETEQFWSLLGGKGEYPSQKIGKEPENDPRLFCCTYSNDNLLKVTEIFNFTQDDLMTEDMFILQCHPDVFVWVGQQVDSKSRSRALSIGEKFLENDFLMENLSHETPVFVVMEGNEPSFFTRFFTWDYSKARMQGDSYQRKLAIVKNGVAPTIDKPKRRTPMSYGGRSSVPDKSQRSRSMSFNPEHARVRGKSPAFNALAANFENANANANVRNLSTPPPVVRKLYPKSTTQDSANVPPESAAISAITSSFGSPRQSINMIPKSLEVSPEGNKTKQEANSNHSSASISGRLEPLTIQEDVKENETEDEEGLPIFPYERLIRNSTDPVTEIDVTKRETYLSSVEFKEKFGMAKDAFYKLPKWKQNKQKLVLQLF